MKLRYREFQAQLGESPDIADTAVVIGRMEAGGLLVMRAYATVRADGEHIRIGRGVYFGEHATSHIVDSKKGTTLGDEVTVARYGVVHGCTMGNRVVVGEGAAVIDHANVGDDAVIAADSIVSPNKTLAGGWLYQGVPAQPVRELSAAEVAKIARSIREGNPDPIVRSRVLPAMPGDSGSRSATKDANAAGRADTAYIAPTARVAGDVQLGEDSGIYFGCVVDAHDGRIVIGPRTNVQDNSFLIASAASGELVLGTGVTIGHNVQLGSGTFGEDCLVGMMSRVEDNVIVERGGCIAAGAWVEGGTVVKAGWIWAGRPARAFRELKPAERVEFARGRDVYIEYGATYRAGD